MRCPLLEMALLLEIVIGDSYFKQSSEVISGLKTQLTDMLTASLTTFSKVF